MKLAEINKQFDEALRIYGENPSPENRRMLESAAKILSDVINAWYDEQNEPDLPHDEPATINMKMSRTIEDGIRGYHSEFTRPDSYYDGMKETELTSFAQMARFKDRSIALFDRRWQAACEVIDIIATKIGIDINEYGRCIYGVYWDHKTGIATSPLGDRIDEWFSKSGDKVKLKKRISELEKENELLRRMLH